MEKVILKDKTELEILSGASLTAITAIFPDFIAMGAAAEALKEGGNLDFVQFASEEAVTGEYEDMKLESPLFRSVDIVEGRVQAVFAIREKTEVEKRLDVLERGQQVQDGAIVELGDVVSEISERGAV